MSAGAEGKKGTAPFTERFGINRRRASLGGAVIGAVFLIALAVMSQRMRDRQAAMEVNADSTEDATPMGSSAEGDRRAAWADPAEARRLAGDTAPVPGAPDPSTKAGGWVPVGHEVGPETYADASAGSLGAPPSTTGRVGPDNGVAVPADPRPADPGSGAAISPPEMRRAAYVRAVSSRRLRAATVDPHETRGDDTAGRAGEMFGGTAAGASDTAVASPTRPLTPYGPQQIEEDRKAAERATLQLTPPPADLTASAGEAAGVRFASFAARPCGSGERILGAGYAISATLVSEINSEIPGPVIARIGRDVYDPRLACVVLPAGALLIGRYETGLAVGGQRLVIVWNQVRLADGRTWLLPSLPVADRRGAPGVPGSIDRRTRETLEGAALLSALGAAIEYATPGGGQVPSGGVSGYPQAPSARDRAVGAATLPLRSAADRLLERAVDAKPVLHLGAGHPITVLVPQDVDLDHPAPVSKDSVPIAPRVLPGSAV